MLQENVHRLPQRVIQDLDHFLVNEWIGDGRFAAVVAFRSRQCQRQCAGSPRLPQRRRHLRVALGRAEPHHDIFGAQYRFEPRTEQRRDVERRQRALADDHRMHEFHRHVLRIGRVRTLPEGQQTPARQEALRHDAADFGQPLRFPLEERFADSIALEQAARDARGEFDWVGQGVMTVR